jgi:hypothetical protein
VTVCCGDEPFDLGLGTHVDAHAFHGFMHQATHIRIQCGHGLFGLDNDTAMKDGYSPAPN